MGRDEIGEEKRRDEKKNTNSKNQLTHGKFSEKNFSIPHRIAFLIHDNEQNEEPKWQKRARNNENKTNSDNDRIRIFTGETKRQQKKLSF